MQGYSGTAGEVRFKLFNRILIVLCSNHESLKLYYTGANTQITDFFELFFDWFFFNVASIDNSQVGGVQLKFQFT